ncbi:MAG: ATP-binding protein [Lachnospiraceae bacterium]|jgi:DNA replication protein DnaC|nr:ATP-binding protein [Lachnospiraceae bacterium]
MALTSDQYQSIMLTYAEKQDRHRRELERRRAGVYAAIPEYRALEESVPAKSLSYLTASLEAGADADGFDPAGAEASLKKEFEAAAQKKKDLLVSHGYPENYLEPLYDCPVCRDTGFTDGHKCRCFIRQEVSLLYSQSHVCELARTENFSVLSEKWYKGVDLQRFHKAAEASRLFVREFDTHSRSLYFYGTVGTGKSFLSVCIAHDLIESGHSVLYFSAISLFEKISSYSFDYKARESLAGLYEDLYGCDLLIIDDLGTETTNTFVTSQLFACINERHLRGRSTLISTNLSLAELQARYSDRVFSRITSDYSIFQFTGNDIRLQKKLLAKQAAPPD